MGVKEACSMDIESNVIIQTYELADLINQSEEMQNYKKYQKLLDQDEQVMELKKRLNKAKILFDEAQRFGHFHPNYHEAKEKVEKLVIELDELPVVKSFKQAEQEMDDLLYLISKTIAHSISSSILVPKEDGLTGSSSCGVGSCNSCGISNSCAI